VKHVSLRQILTIVALLISLIGIIVLKQRCGIAVENMFRAVANVPDGGEVSSQHP
jgi:hypothetical protein